MAERCGPDFPAVLRQPFALTLYAYQQLQERDRIRRLLERDADVYYGILTAMAMNDPKQLESERTDALSEMRRPVGAARRRVHHDELLARGNALADRILASGVLAERPALPAPPAS